MLVGQSAQVARTLDEGMQATFRTLRLEVWTLAHTVDQSANGGLANVFVRGLAQGSVGRVRAARSGRCSLPMAS